MVDKASTVLARSLVGLIWRIDHTIHHTTKIGA